MVASFIAHKDPRNAFLTAFAVQSIIIISTILVFSLKNDNLIAIYLTTVVLSTIVLSIIFLLRSSSNWLNYWREAGLFSAPVIGILIVFAIFIFLLTGRLGIPGPLLWVIALAIAGWFATIKYRKNMEKQLGRNIKSEYELTSLSSWMEIPAEINSTNQKSHVENNQRLQEPIVNNSPKIRNPGDNLTTIAGGKNQDKEFGENPLGTKIMKFDRQKQIQMRENLTLLLETARTKGRKALEEEAMKMVSGKGESSDNLTIDQSLELGNPLEPRIYHYIFAHKYLPDKLSASSQGVIAWLTGEKGIEHLKTRWALLPTVYNLKPEDFIEPVGINRYVIKPTNRHKHSNKIKL